MTSNKCPLAHPAGAALTAAPPPLGLGRTHGAPSIISGPYRECPMLTSSSPLSVVILAICPDSRYSLRDYLMPRASDCILPKRPGIPSRDGFHVVLRRSPPTT